MWTSADIPDLSGRTAVVTGANGGLGLQTALALATAGAHVVMAARDPDKTAAARAAVVEAVPSAEPEVVPLDLADLDSVRAAATTIADAHDRIDVLVNNAGLMAMPERRTAQGFEMQFGVNHLGHHVLTAGLLAPLLRADRARVVTVTSTARHTGRPVDPANPHLVGRYEPWRAYGQSKLANLHFALGLHRQFTDAGVAAASLAAHPGLSNTDLQARTVREGGAGGLGPFFHSLTARLGMPPERGVLPQLRAATDPGARSGELYAPRWGSFGAPVRRPVLRRAGLQRHIDTLWHVSERETGTPLDVAAVLESV